MNSIAETGKVQNKAKRKGKIKLGSRPDESWKDILNEFFPEFMQFCWPQIYDDIDWEKGFEFLDKELQSLVKYKKKGKRFVDKLVKVWHKTHGNIFIILHVEIQNQKELDFSFRMFSYHYLLLDRHKAPVVSLAVFIDGDKNWRPEIYENEMWNCQIRFKYPILKLIDFESDIQSLENSDNPFALVVLYQLRALRSNDNIDTRFSFKYNLIKALKKKKWGRNKIDALFKFLDNILRMPEPVEQKLYFDLVQEKQETDSMSYSTSFEYFAELRGIEIGEKRGEQRGKKVGEQIGIQKGEANILLSLLKSKFKKVPQHYASRIKNANPDIILTWADRVLYAKTIDEVFG